MVSLITTCRGSSRWAIWRFCRSKRYVDGGVPRPIRAPTSTPSSDLNRSHITSRTSLAPLCSLVKLDVTHRDITYQSRHSLLRSTHPLPVTPDTYKRIHHNSPPYPGTSKYYIHSQLRTNNSPELPDTGQTWTGQHHVALFSVCVQHSFNRLLMVNMVWQALRRKKQLRVSERTLQMQCAASTLVASHQSQRYKQLTVPRNAAAPEIHKQYQVLVMQSHPDRITNLLPAERETSSSSIKLHADATCTNAESETRVMACGRTATASPMKIMTPAPTSAPTATATLAASTQSLTRITTAIPLQSTK